jgi:hypothetical protein
MIAKDKEVDIVASTIKHIMAAMKDELIGWRVIVAQW